MKEKIRMSVVMRETWAGRNRPRFVIKLVINKYVGISVPEDLQMISRLLTKSNQN